MRSSTARVTDVLGGTIKPGESWTPEVALPGLAGTNRATLEVSRVPPLDLGRRLEYLLGYPHGCVEQTVSAAFPQLFLGKLLELTPEKQARAETNVKAALERLRRFQASDGGFGYWPGDDDSADWATNYAGHFAVEAQKAGYLPPPGAARPVDVLPAAARPGLGAGRGPGGAHPGLPALHARARGCGRAAGHEPAARAGEPARGREVAARRRVPARGPARGRAGARRGRRR